MRIRPILVPNLMTVFVLCAVIGLPCICSAGSFAVSGPDFFEKRIHGISRRAAVSDGAGGMFVAWHGKPQPCETCADTFRVSVQRVTASHVPAPGWPALGRSVSTHPASETEAVLTPDGSSGVLVAWRDARENQARIYAQRLDASGNVYAGWSADGVRLSGQFNFDHNPLICSDGAGGAFVVWADQSDAALFGQHVESGGAIAAGWPAEGSPLCQTPGTNSNYALCPDGSGGFFVAWEDTRAGGQPDLYALRVTAAGTVAPGWSTNGTPVSTAIGWQRLPQMCADGSGGVILTWMDQRNDPNDIYAMRLLGDGSVAPGWTAGGTPICQAAGFQWNPAIASDGSGGAHIAWYDRRDVTTDATYAARVTGNGDVSAGWPTNGLHVSAGPRSGEHSVVPDGQHGAILTWNDDSRIFAQRLTANGQVADGWPDGGLLAAVSATSLAGFGAIPVCLVAESNGSIFLVWPEDRQTQVYGTEVVAVHLDGEGTTVVSVPEAPTARTALRLSIPQIAKGSAVLDYSVPNSAPAELKLLDISGRLLWRHGSDAGAGTHQTILDAAGIRPGVYWVRLSQDRQAIAKRIVIVH